MKENRVHSQAGIPMLLTALAALVTGGVLLSSSPLQSLLGLLLLFAGLCVLPGL